MLKKIKITVKSLFFFCFLINFSNSFSLINPANEVTEEAKEIITRSKLSPQPNFLIQLKHLAPKIKKYSSDFIDVYKQTKDADEKRSLEILATQDMEKAPVFKGIKDTFREYNYNPTDIRLLEIIAEEPEERKVLQLAKQKGQNKLINLLNIL